jgi:predicted nucleic acid-binding protein
MTIVDSSVWIDFLADRPTTEVVWLKQRIPTHRVGLTDLILYELLQGVRDEVRFLQLREKFSHFDMWSTMTPGLEVKAARNDRELRRRGITVRKTIDCLIATFCIEGDHELLHNDHDFDGFEEYLGLRVIHPKLQ